MQLVSPDSTPFDFGTNIVYNLRVEKIYNDYRVTISEKSGPQSFSHFIINTPNGYNTARGTFTKYGMLHGAPGFTCYQGRFRCSTSGVTRCTGRFPGAIHRRR